MGSKINVVNLDRSESFLLILLVSAFTFCSIYLIPHKPPWVDEMYTWYGINHDDFGQFQDSIESGINYSPPLYFFINWICQLFFPLSLNALRIESLLWILGGTTLVYLMLRKQLGSAAALIGVGGVLLQSSLLLGQSMEARSYGLFFFCGATVLYMGQPIIIRKGTRSRWSWLFIAHLALCLTHYLGIVFSGFAALARYLSSGTNRKVTIRTFPEIASWIACIPLYGYLISGQSDHLSAWPRPNDIQDLLASYLDSVNPLFFSIPIILALFLNQSSKNEHDPGEDKDNNNFILFCSILWISIPVLIWVLSHFTQLNLFKDRYFIPKEAAWMVLTALIISRIPFLRSNSRKTLICSAAAILFGIAILFVSTQRQLFALKPSRNYYHWLMVDGSIRNSSLAKVYTGDHLYFPNLEDSKSETSFLWIDSDGMHQTYKAFSNDVRTIDTNEIFKLQNFILIHDWSQEEYIKRFNIGRAEVNKRMRVNKHSKFYADEIQLYDDLLK